MKKLIILFFGILLLTSVFAQEIATIEDIQDAGITPENPIIYALDIVIERLTESFSENAKLNHVTERLAEMKVMIHKNKMPEAIRVKQEFDLLRIKIKNQSQIEEHKKLMDNLGQRISSIMAISKGNMTLIQREELRSQVKILIEEHKEKIRNETINIITKRKILPQTITGISSNPSGSGKGGGGVMP